MPALRAKRRILIATSHYGRTGGTGTHVIASVRALRRAGYPVTIVAETCDPTVDRASDVALIPGLGEPSLDRSNSSNGVPRKSRDAFLALVRHSGAGVVHVHDLHDHQLLHAARRHAPLVWSVHNYFGCIGGYKYFGPGHECHRAQGLLCFPNVLFRGCGHTRIPRPSVKLYRLNNRLLDGLRGADAVVCYSEYIERDLASNCVRKTSVVPLLVEPLPDPAPPPHTATVLFSGRVIPHKGPQVL